MWCKGNILQNTQPPSKINLDIDALPTIFPKKSWTSFDDVIKFKELSKIEKQLYPYFYI
jgi:hypothetical protein